MRAYRVVIKRFIHEFGDGHVNQVTPEQILTFLNRLAEGNKPYTKRTRYSQLSSFFNFVRNNIDPELLNPCDRPMIRKLYKKQDIQEEAQIPKSFKGLEITASMH